MKPLPTLAATAFTWAATTLVVTAQVPSAGANFTSAQGVPFSLVLDGHLMTNPVARQVHVVQLMPGRHWVDITLTTPYGQPLRVRSTVWLQAGLATNYVLVMQPYGPRLQQVGAVALGRPLYGPNGSYNGAYNGSYPQQAPPAEQNGAYGNYSPQAPPVGQNGTYDNSYPQQAPPAGQNGAYGNYPPQPPTAGRNGTYNDNYPQQAPPAQQNGTYNGGYSPQAPPTGQNGTYSAPNVGNYPPQSQPNPNTGYPDSYPGTAPYGNNPTNAAPPPAPTPGLGQPDTAPASGYDPNDTAATANGSNLAPLPADEVQALTQELRAHPSDNARLGIAKQALAQNSVTAEELAQLLGTLNLDKGRITLAEFGYAHVSDPQNFPVIYEVFHLPSSAHEVQQALGLPQD